MEEARAKEPDALDRKIALYTLAGGVVINVGVTLSFFAGERILRDYQLATNRNAQLALVVFGALALLGAVGCALRALRWLRSRVVGFVFVGLLDVATLGVGLTLQRYVPEVDYEPSGVVPKKHTILVGMTVTFATPPQGARQTLCIGQGGRCSPRPKDDDPLGEALTVSPGERKSVVFPRLGTYPITSRTSPSMDMMIEVVPPSDGE